MQAIAVRQREIEIKGKKEEIEAALNAVPSDKRVTIAGNVEST